MNSTPFLQSLVTLHLLGLVMMAGTTIIDYNTYRTLWKQFDSGYPLSAGLMAARAKFPRIIGIGAALLIFTGIGMMALTNGVFGEMLWFRIKFGLVILLILNVFLVGRRQGQKLDKLSSGMGSSTQISIVRSYLNYFYLLQFTLFLLIVFLSVFKFS